MKRIVDHFYLREFTKMLSQKECQDILSDDDFFLRLFRMMQVADLIRKRAGEPMIITSTYRDAEHNRRVGGDRNSYHLKCMAFDFKPYKVEGASLGKFEDVLKEMQRTGAVRYLRYSWGFHVTVVE